MAEQGDLDEHHGAETALAEEESGTAATAAATEDSRDADVHHSYSKTTAPRLDL